MQMLRMRCRKHSSRYIIKGVCSEEIFHFRHGFTGLLTQPALTCSGTENCGDFFLTGSRLILPERKMNT
jgi:hypothetical protein